MTVRRIVWFGVSGVALASWFAAASTSGVRPTPAPPPPSPAAVDRSMSTLQSEIGKLHERIAPAATPTRSRDLFHFSTRVPTRAAAPGSATPPAETAPASPATPSAAFMLIGIAEDSAPDGAPSRTAILKGVFDLFLVKPGDSILGRYRVEQVSSDAVQLVDTTTNLPMVLTLH
jgi:hypothetical protein